MSKVNLKIIQRSFVRGLAVCCLATMLAVTVGVWLDAQSVVAAPASAMTVRQDRRPDRERPVKTSQGSSQEGFSHYSSSGTSSGPARPRLVRR